MSNRIQTVILCTLLLFPLCAEAYNKKTLDTDKIVNEIETYQVVIPSKIKAEIKNDNPGLGSSLTFKQKTSDGTLWFYSVTDRGLNIDLPGNSGPRNARVFMDPQFSPFISLIKLTPGQSATVENITRLKATGLPPKETSDKASEIPMNLDKQEIEFDPNGMDPEALDIDANGNFWIGEEYQPSIVQVNPQGKIIKRLTPGNGIPEIMKYRTPNRGFEALAVTKSGKIVFLLESAITLNAKSNLYESFIRLAKLDPETGKCAMFVYQFDHLLYKSPLSVKIGDIAAIDEDRFLVVEQGEQKDGTYQNSVQLIDLRGATDISTIEKNNEIIEESIVEEMVEPVKKHLLFKAQNYNWPYKKLEGVAYIDPTHIALINDNDFGYETDHSQNNVSDSDQKINYHPTHQPTEIWIMTLKDSL
jgi:hypothetical protein